MEKMIKEGKDVETILETILTENSWQKDDIVYTTLTKKGKLFQGNIVEVTVYPKKEIWEEVKNYLINIIKPLGMDLNFEVSSNEDRTTIKMYSDNNPILIGKNGQTIKALETLVRQMLQNKYSINVKISLDVQDYKVKKEKYLVKMVKGIAKDVARTKVEAKLDNMTSYERRIVHNALTDFKGVITESEGEEPNRHIVIRPE